MSEQDRMPECLGPYRLLDRIGEGGMGVVYLARDAQQRSVALKVLRPAVAGEPNARRRLAREVETMRRVRSPYVAEVFDADLDGDLPYIVTRYVPGRTLEDVVGEQGPLQLAALAKLARGLAEALIAVHAAGVVHRDLKPSNVMLVNGTPVVIDFGIAQAADTTRLTTTGMFMGTPGYLSPEVIEGQPSSEASDVHAWGATVAFAATGRPPFGSGPYETIFYRIVNGTPDLAGAAPALVPLLASALARDPGQRPAAFQLRSLTAALDESQLVPTPVPAGGPGQAGAADVTRGDYAAAVPGLTELGPPGPGGGQLAASAGQTPAGAAPAPPPPGTLRFGAVPVGQDGLPAQGGPGSGAMPPNPVQAAPDDYSDLLPPATYQPEPWAGNGRPQIPPPAPTAAGMSFGAMDAAGGRAASRVQTVLVVAAVALLAGVSVLFPVAGTAIAMALLLSMRAGELGHSAAVRRRARGARPNPAVTVLAFPWFLLRSLLACLMLIPFALAAGVVMGGISIAAQPGEPLSRAIAYGAGALVAFYGIGPGSSRARRQLGRLLTFRAPATRALTGGGLMVMAVAALAAAVTWPSVFWPVKPPGQLVHLAVAPGGAYHQFTWMARYLVSHLRGL